MMTRTIKFAKVIFVSLGFTPHASAQTSGYFSEWQDGTVIREVGREVVAMNCRVDPDSFLEIVADVIERFGQEIKSTPEEYAGIIIGNLQARQQVEINDSERIIIFKNTGACE